MSDVSRFGADKGDKPTLALVLASYFEVVELARSVIVPWIRGPLTGELTRHNRDCDE